MNNLKKIGIYALVIAFVLTGFAGVSQARRLSAPSMAPVYSQPIVSKDLYSYKGKVVTPVASPVTSVVVSEVTSEAGTSKVPSAVTSSVASAVVVKPAISKLVNVNNLPLLTKLVLDKTARKAYVANPDMFKLSNAQKQAIIELYQSK